MRNLKALGLALIAVLAMSALIASTASATDFHSSKPVTTYVDSQRGVFKFVTNTGVIICNEMYVVGTQVGVQVGPGTYAMVTRSGKPKYSECEFEELFTVTVSVNNCEYTLDVSESGEAFVGNVTIESCNESVPYIQFGSLATCRIRVGEQEVGESIYAVVGSNLEVTTEISGISYSESGLFCAGGAVNNGTFEGIDDVTGTEGEAEAELSIA